MHIFFDLDGTLTDSSPGITRCVNHALASLGVAPLPDDRLRPMIGSPLARIFADVLACDDVPLIDRAVRAYRVRFNEIGMFENALYPGVADILTDLCRRGHTLQIVTAKPAVAAGRIAAHFGIADCFAAVHGPDLADRDCDKAALLHAALRLVDAHPDTAAMVGDRAVDILAARQHRVASIGAAWGYGSRDELVTAGADFVAESARDVVAWVDARTATVLK